MTREVQPILAGSLLTLVLLIIAHVALWEYRERVRRVHAYVVGVTCIGLGVTLASLLLDQWIIAITFWAVTGPGGFAVAIARWVRWVREEQSSGRATAARIIQQAEEKLNRAIVSGESDHHRN